MTEPKRSRPRDPKQFAKLIADIATGETPERVRLDDGRNAAAVALGRLGGLKGGHSRAASLSPERRAEIASKAAAARWGKSRG